MSEPELCICSHFHGGTCHCGCTVYITESGSDYVSALVDWQIATGGLRGLQK